jgi:predicted transcriptional regulator YdeE
MFAGESKTEIIEITEEIKVVGLSLQKSGLPISFNSLGELWGIYSNENRYNIPNHTVPIVEYGICLNKIPDYITGCAVSEIGQLSDTFISFIIPKGKYIKDAFAAQTFEELTTKTMETRNVKKWAKENNIKINNEFNIEVYPIEAIENICVEMYTLTPIK